MKKGQRQLVSVFLSFCFCRSVCDGNNTLAGSLDVILHDHALKGLENLRKPHTGALYHPTLPSDLAGMSLSAVQLRSRTLWRNGANFSSFSIPSRTLPVPYVRRLLILYHDLGNWSSLYCSIEGYAFLTSVVGFTVYDASRLNNVTDPSKVELNTTLKPISVRFSGSAASVGSRRRVKCAVFDGEGVHLTERKLPDLCYTKNQGHFAIVVQMGKEQKVWGLWVIGFVIGLLGLVLAGLAGIVLVRVCRVKRIQEMEKETEEGEALENIWIGNSKMPSATVTRTHPLLETAGAP